VLNERENCSSIKKKKKKNERELWKCSLKCMRVRSAVLLPPLSLFLTFTIYDAFWNSIKNECVWHKTSERKEKKRKWDNHTSLFKHLTSRYIVQCFFFYDFYLWEEIHQYILNMVASKQVCLTFDDFSLSSLALLLELFV
jgi:hypothetical protein